MSLSHFEENKRKQEIMKLSGLIQNFAMNAQLLHHNLYEYQCPVKLHHYAWLLYCQLFDLKALIADGSLVNLNMDKRDFDQEPPRYKILQGTDTDYIYYEKVNVKSRESFDELTPEESIEAHVNILESFLRIIGELKNSLHQNLIQDQPDMTLGDVGVDYTFKAYWAYFQINALAYMVDYELSGYKYWNFNEQ